MVGTLDGTGANAEASPVRQSNKARERVDNPFIVVDALADCGLFAMELYQLDEKSIRVGGMADEFRLGDGSLMSLLTRVSSAAFV